MNLLWSATWHWRCFSRIHSWIYIVVSSIELIINFWWVAKSTWVPCFLVRKRGVLRHFKLASTESVFLLLLDLVSFILIILFHVGGSELLILVRWWSFVPWINLIRFSLIIILPVLKRVSSGGVFRHPFLLLVLVTEVVIIRLHVI